MYKVLAIVLTLCIFKDTIAYCCFRDALMLPTKCGCPDVDTCGIITCNACSSISPCCNCGVPTSPCIRDTCNVCFVCDPKPSPVCACLKSVDGCGGDCTKKCGCGCEEKTFVYFPEVEYPSFVLEMKPFYYGSCFNY